MNAELRAAAQRVRKVISGEEVHVVYSGHGVLDADTEFDLECREIAADYVTRVLPLFDRLTDATRRWDWIAVREIVGKLTSGEDAK